MRRKTHSLFVTGGTGYLGSYVVTDLLADPDVERVFLLSRASGPEEEQDKLWRALQLHMDEETFRALLPRIEIVHGDLAAPGLGIAPRTRERIMERCDTVLHIAASLNRKSDKACFNANLRGSLSVIQLVRALAEHRGGLHRYGVVSTTAVSGKREHQLVTEDESIDWDLSDYDPYARTKKFAEHMTHELLPDVDKVIMRPPTVMGDSRFPQTSQFEMVRITCAMFDLPAVPVHPDTRLDFVPANYVGSAIAKLIMKPELRFHTYHLSAGEDAVVARELHARLVREGIHAPRMMPGLLPLFAGVSGQLANAPRGNVSLFASLVKVFLPYFTNDVVFDNTRLKEELGVSVPRFVDYFPDTYRWAKSVAFRYPYRPLTGRPSARSTETGERATP
ncbi:MAG: SDR family oxidoreductase [Sandaracinaceae bacterium]